MVNPTRKKLSFYYFYRSYSKIFYNFMFDLHKEVKENAIQKKKKKTCREKSFIALIKKMLLCFWIFVMLV